MGAIAGIAGAVLSGTGQSGQKGVSGEGNASQQNTNISGNGGMSQPEMKTADVDKAAETTEEPKKEKSGSNVDWAELAKMATGLLSSGNGSSAPISVGNASNGGTIANFR